MYKQGSRKCLGISMIVCRNPVSGKFLVVQEVNGKWWIPGGRVEAPETFMEAGKRQCKEEAGVDVEIKGVLRMEHQIYADFVRLKSILYAEPIDPQQKPKQEPDQESRQGQYMSLQQIEKIKPIWRTSCIYKWPKYISEGGTIYPLSILKETSS